MCEPSDEEKSLELNGRKGLCVCLMYVLCVCVLLFGRERKICAYASAIFALTIAQYLRLTSLGASETNICSRITLDALEVSRLGL